MRVNTRGNDVLYVVSYGFCVCLRPSYALLTKATEAGSMRRTMDLTPASLALPEEKLQRWICRFGVTFDLASWYVSTLFISI